MNLQLLIKINMYLTGSDSKLQDKKILVLEAGDRVKLEENLGLYSNRVSTISPGSQNLLESKFNNTQLCFVIDYYSWKMILMYLSQNIYFEFL